MPTRYVDLTPTWRAAVQIYMAVLENGTEEGKQSARAELLKLADIVDGMNADAKKGASQ